jgi:hypothetical protein
METTDWWALSWMEVTPTEEQQVERNIEQKERKSGRRMAKEKEHEIRQKYRPRYACRRRM